MLLYFLIQWHTHIGPDAVTLRFCFIKGTLMHNQMHIINILLIDVKMGLLFNKCKKYKYYFCVNFTAKPPFQIKDLNTEAVQTVYKIWESVRSVVDRCFTACYYIYFTRTCNSVLYKMLYKARVYDTPYDEILYDFTLCWNYLLWYGGYGECWYWNKWVVLIWPVKKERYHLR